LASRIDKDKTAAFVGMFQSKLGGDSTQSYIRDHFRNSQVAIDVAERYNLPELENVMVEKWMDGRRTFPQLLEHHTFCRKVNSKRKTEGLWDDEKEQTFNEKTLAIL